MSRILIETKHLSLDVPYFQPKDRKLLSNPIRLLTDFYVSRTSRTVTTILDDISFTLHAGERLGVIGANGAGKSTLLRLLAGVYAPTRGECIINGNAQGLFHISLGMDMEGTGIENIYLRGLQMGLTLKHIKFLVQDVVEFSELGDHIKKPINTYSTGMMLRLAFAISTMIEPDILLLDEWIGAGDANFREKAEARMNSLVDKSRGLILATHNPGLMKKLCTKGLVLHKGRVAFYGELEDAQKFFTVQSAKDRS